MINFLQHINSPTSIVSLELVGGPIIKGLPACLESFTELQGIKLIHSTTNSENTTFSISVLDTLTQLKAIDLTVIELGAFDAARQIQLNLEANLNLPNPNKLEKLNLTGFLIPLENLKMLLQTTPNLKELYITENHIDDPAKCQALCDSLPANLRSIKLKADYYSEFFEERLTNFLQQIKSPTSIVSLELVGGLRIKGLPRCLERFTNLQEIKLCDILGLEDTCFSIDVLKTLAHLKVIVLDVDEDCKIDQTLKTTPLSLQNPEILEDLGFFGVEIPLPDLIILLQNTPNLEELSLEHLGLEILPFDCKQLPKLRILNIEWNKFSELPINFFSDLTHLEELYLYYNQFRTKPPGIPKNVKVFNLTEQDDRDE